MSLCTRSGRRFFHVLFLGCFLFVGLAGFDAARAGAASEYVTGSLIDRSTPEGALSFFIKSTNEIRDFMEFFKKKREETRS
jgi:hypothetical protein